MNVMKKIFWLFILIFKLSGAFGQDHYYYHDQQIELENRKNYLLLKFNKSLDRSQYSEIIKVVEKMGAEPVSEFEPSNPYAVLKLDKDNYEDISNALASFDDIASSSYMYGSANAKTLSGQTDEIFVRFKVYDPKSNITYLKEKNIEILEEIKKIPGLYRVKVSRGISAINTANDFYESGNFLFAEPNFFYYKALNSLDVFFSMQWYLKNTGQNGGLAGQDIKIEDAWAITSGKESIKIAVLDNGILPTHPDLQANLLPGYTVSDIPPSYTFSAEHGTKNAGLIGAIKDNNIGIAGVAPSCKLLDVRMSLSEGFTAGGGAEGILWAADVDGGDVDVINASWSFDNPSSTLESAINWAVTNGRNGLGSVIVCSVGNDFDAVINFPASLPNVIAVGACDKNGSKTDYSSYGPELDVIAPGGEYHPNEDIITCDNQGQYSQHNGTSAAAPLVSGVAALCLSVNPCLTYQEVARIIKLSADKFGAIYCGSSIDDIHNQNFGSGKLNAANAVRLAKYYDNLFEVTNPTITQTASNASIFLYNACSVNDGSHNGNIYTASKTIVNHYPTASYLLFSNGINSVMTQDNVNGTLTVYAGAYYVNDLSQWMPSPTQDIHFWVLPYYNSTDLFLQNRTENSFTNIFQTPGSIFAGKNVTTAVSPGNYVLNAQNNIKLVAKNAIFFEAGFECSTGNYLETVIGNYNACPDFPEGVPKPAREGEKVRDVKLLVPLMDFSMLDESEFQIYPNPTNEEIHINFASNSMAKVVITSIDGRVLKTIALPNRRNTLSLKGLSDGSYYLRIINGEKVTTKKIVKLNKN